MSVLFCALAAVTEELFSLILKGLLQNTDLSMTSCGDDGDDDDGALLLEMIITPLRGEELLSFFINVS